MHPVDIVEVREEVGERQRVLMFQFAGEGRGGRSIYRHEQ